MSNYPPGSENDQNAPWNKNFIECPDCGGTGIIIDSDEFCRTCERTGEIPDEDQET